MLDTRNVTDEFKGQPIEAIVEQLDARGVTLEIALENLTRDYNMGTIVRSANAFGVRHVHIVGRRRWNSRGAMMTDKYLHIHHHTDVAEFMRQMSGKQLIAIDNVTGATPLQSAALPESAVLVFGSEGDGLSGEMLAAANQIVAIEQLGSTRSLNVGVAAGVVMYEWLRQRWLAIDKTYYK